MARLDGQAILCAGEVLGTYQLLMPVGAGGMGRVWAARRLNSPTTQFVAVKTALEELSGDAEFERIFIDEARIASSIVHPNVCTIYEMGSERSIPYLVMEWVNGGSLHDILAASSGHRIDVFHAVRIVASVCAGLHAAHELTDLDGVPLNVVHRDVSPQNILLSASGHVKIADFGVARARGQLHRPTVTGEFKGKLSYMAPEQLTTKTFDRRADVFALGCVLYQATTGQRPFHGGDALETMYKLLETECEAPSALRAQIPRELETIILKALSKNLETRFQTAEELEHALERFLASNGQLITDRDVSSLVSGALSPVISRRTEELRVALEAANHPRSTLPPAPQRESHDDAPASSRTSLSRRALAKPGTLAAKSGTKKRHDPAVTPRGTWETHRPRTDLSRSKTATWKGLSIGASVLLLAGTAAGWPIWMHLSAPSKQQLSEVAKAPSANVNRVEVRVRTQPASAAIVLDEERTATGLLVVSAEPSPRLHKIVATMAGYALVQRELAFDRSMDVLIELHPLDAIAPTVDEKPATTVPARPQATLRPAAPNTTAQSPSVRPPDGMSAKSRKPKRPLDPTNPFSEP